MRRKVLMVDGPLHGQVCEVEAYARHYLAPEPVEPLSAYEIMSRDPEPCMPVVTYTIIRVSLFGHLVEVATCNQDTSVNDALFDMLASPVAKQIATNPYAEQAAMAGQRAREWQARERARHELRAGGEYAPESAPPARMDSQEQERQRAFEALYGRPPDRNQPPDYHARMPAKPGACADTCWYAEHGFYRCEGGECIRPDRRSSDAQGLQVPPAARAGPRPPHSRRGVPARPAPRRASGGMRPERRP